MSTEIYPGIYQRIVAAFIDSVIIIILMIIIVDIFSYFDTVHDIARIIAFVLVFCLYDPIFTSVFGGTIGHKTSGLRVKRAKNQEKNLFFHIALLRYLFKVLLGWISLLTVSGNPKRQAIHDSFVGSVVIYNKTKK